MVLRLTLVPKLKNVLKLLIFERSQTWQTALQNQDFFVECDNCYSTSANSYKLWNRVRPYAKKNATKTNHKVSVNFVICEPINKFRPGIFSRSESKNISLEKYRILQWKMFRSPIISWLLRYLNVMFSGLILKSLCCIWTKEEISIKYTKNLKWVMKCRMRLILRFLIRWTAASYI